MKPLYALPVALLLCASARADALDAVAWLAGCWQHTGRDAGSVEVWTAPAGGQMLGLGRLTRSGRVVDFEFMQLRAEPDGTLSYIAQPQGRPPTSFRLLQQTDAEVVFENPAHDFPQRVRYRREGTDRLLARIEGQRDGKERAVDFPMQKASCP